MAIEIIDESNYLTHTQHQLMIDIIQQAANQLGIDFDYAVDISIVSDAIIHQLNLDYRGIDRPTDVLSFALTESENAQILADFATQMALEQHLGDIIISFPKIKEQAEEYGHSFERELGFLTVHGFLHLNGYDHQTELEAQEMFQLQDDILTQFGLVR